MWQIWKFEQIPKEYWEQLNNQKLFMDWLGEELGHRTKSDWFNLQINEFSIRNAGSLIASYHNSPIKLLQAISL